MIATDIPHRNPVAVLREEFDDWAMLYNPDTGGALGINPIGVDIWKLIDGKKTIAEIAAIITNSYEDAPDSVEEDVIEFLGLMALNALIGFPYEEKA